MKIISPYKDYYDYLTGVYGIDDKVIYVRKTEYPVDYSTQSVLSMWVCNELYLGLKFNGQWVWEHDNHVELWDRMEKDHRFERTVPSSYYWPLRQYLHRDFYNERMKGRYGTQHPAPPKDYNTYHNCPVILQDGEINICNPKLDKSGIISVLPAQDIYLKIIDFLSYKEPDIVTLPNDMNRFESKGFDKKTSFRKL